MSRRAFSSSIRTWPLLEQRRCSVAELQQSLRLAEREEFGVRVGEVAGAFDVLDRANAVEGRDSAMLRAEVLSSNQLQIEHAIQRAAEGQYGLCEDCDRPIPGQRLKAWPEATRCVECQRRHEQGSGS
jgi:phage/conjugal plasmid C-4 type zinc finger TraR family protein